MNEITTFRPGALEEAKPDQMPHSIEAEQQLLGAILTNNDVFDRIAMIVSKDHFYDPVHARIFDVAAQRIAKNAPLSIAASKQMVQNSIGRTEEEGWAEQGPLAGRRRGQGGEGGPEMILRRRIDGHALAA